MHASRAALRLFAVALFTGAASGCAPPGAAPPPLLRLVATDFAFDAPREVAAGFTRIRLVNQGRAWHYALLAELPENATADSYLAGVRAGEDFPASAVDIGGPGLVSQGDSSEAVLDLRPGRYVIICWYDNHLMAGMIAPLTVTRRSGTAAPAPPHDNSVIMRDYTFEFSHPFRTGLQVVHVTNVGTRPHEFDVYRLEPGRTRQDFEAWQATRRGAPPAIPVGGVADFVPTREAWVSLQLRPGRYVILCEVPEGERTHAEMGMVEEFEVQ